MYVACSDSKRLSRISYSERKGLKWPKCEKIVEKVCKFARVFFEKRSAILNCILLHVLIINRYARLGKLHCFDEGHQKNVGHQSDR